MLVPQERSTRGEQGSVRNFSLIVFAQHESRQEPRGGLQRPANSVGSTIRRRLPYRGWLSLSQSYKYKYIMINHCYCRAITIRTFKTTTQSGVNIMKATSVCWALCLFASTIYVSSRVASGTGSSSVTTAINGKCPLMSRLDFQPNWRGSGYSASKFCRERFHITHSPGRRTRGPTSPVSPA